MIGQPKPFASLSSGLLARKGHAKPAMRPQGFGGFGPMTGGHEDLGWNDMGHDFEPAEDDYVPTPTSLSPLTPVGEPEAYEAEDAGGEEPIVLPQVLRQREVLKEEFAIEAEEPAPVEAAAAPSVTLSPARVARIGREVSARKTKAAFTLRLDAERHLRLRLANAVTGRSSQQLVTDALDAFLATLPEVAELADQLPSRRVATSG
jgi:hypothetical protein